MFRRLIDRYIAKEVIRPFLMVIIGVIVIMLSVRLTEDVKLIIVNNVPTPIVLRMILYKLPEFVVLGLPVAYMIATLLGLARMSKDFEIIAIRATGTGSKRIMRPIIIISIFISLISFYLNEVVVPEANRRSKIAAENVAIATADDPANSLTAAKVKFKGVDSRFFYVRVIYKDAKKLEKVLIFDSDPSHEYRMISAPYGEWDGTVWKLHNGVVQRYGESVDGFVEKEQPFKDLDVETNIQVLNYISGEVKPKEMGSDELKALIEATRAGGQETQAYEIEYQSKFARPFATFFAAIIAAPIGLKFARGGYIGFAISIILTFFYFVAQTIGEGLGGLGLLPVLVSAWLPNLLFGVVGLLVYIQVE